MAKWSSNELSFLMNAVNRGVHPQNVLRQLNDEYGNERTTESLKHKLREVGVSYATCVSENTPLSIEEQIAQADKDRQFKTLRRDYSAVLNRLAVQDRMIQVGVETIKSLPAVDYAYTHVTDKINEEECVLLLSDVHAGEVVLNEDMNYLNEYNFDIATYRLHLLVQKIKSIVLNKLIGYNFKKLTVIGLGDMISGNIHEELVEGAKGNIVEWTINLAYVFAQMIQELLQVFPNIHFVGVVGNHGRLYKKPRFKARYTNWDFLCYQYMSLFLANDIKAKKVSFDIPTSFWTLTKINGHTWLSLHGDNINSWNGIPWYGIQRSLDRLRQMIATKELTFKYAAIAHFHNHGVLDTQDGGQLMINGSVIGGNDYSTGKMFMTGVPCQHFCGIHPKRGITFEYKLQLDEAKKPKHPYKMANFSEHALGTMIL